MRFALGYACRSNRRECAEALLERFGAALDAPLGALLDATWLAKLAWPAGFRPPCGAPLPGAQGLSPLVLAVMGDRFDGPRLLAPYRTGGRRAPPRDPRASADAAVARLLLWRGASRRGRSTPPRARRAPPVRGRRLRRGVPRDPRRRARRGARHGSAAAALANAVDARGQTALFWACAVEAADAQQGAAVICEALLAAGADVCRRNARKADALWVAAAAGNAACVGALLATGRVVIDARGPQSKTPLAAACGAATSRQRARSSSSAPSWRRVLAGKCSRRSRTRAPRAASRSSSCCSRRGSGSPAVPRFQGARVRAPGGPARPRP